MKNPDRRTVKDLIQLPNIGPAMADSLRLTGILQPKDLIGKNGYALYTTLCRKSGQKHDPCVIDVFLAAVDFMEGGTAVPWWKFTAGRKKHLLVTK